MLFRRFEWLLSVLVVECMIRLVLSVRGFRMSGVVVVVLIVSRVLDDL